MSSFRGPLYFVEQAIRELETSALPDNRILAEKFKEYGIKVKTKNSTNFAENLTLENGREISLRYKKGATPIGPYQGNELTETILVMHTGTDFYFLPEILSSKVKNKEVMQFYLSERLIKNVGPNRWDFLEALIDKQKEKEVTELYKNKVKTGRGRLPKQNTRTIRSAAPQAAKSISESVSKGTKKGEEALEDLLTTPNLPIKGITMDIDKNMELTFNKDKINICKDDKCMEITNSELQKIMNTVNTMQHYL